MPAYINAIGTAVPNSKISQSKIATYMKQHIEFNEKQSHQLDVIYRASGIDYRYSILPDFHQTTETPGFIMHGREPSLYDRMKLYEIEAPVLAIQSILGVYERKGPQSLNASYYRKLHRHVCAWD